MTSLMTEYSDQMLLAILVTASVLTAIAAVASIKHLQEGVLLLYNRPIA